MTKRNIDKLYEEIPLPELYRRFEFLERQFKKFLKFGNYPSDLDVRVSGRDLIAAIIRVDKRWAYYYFFHDGMELSEMKEAALLAYWVLRFKPFKIANNKYVEEFSASTINESFAIYIIFAALCYVSRVKREKIDSSLDKGPFYNKLLYAFRFRNISWASMMLLAESIGPETFQRGFGDVI